MAMNDYSKLSDLEREFELEMENDLEGSLEFELEHEYEGDDFVGDEGELEFELDDDREFEREFEGARGYEYEHEFGSGSRSDEFVERLMEIGSREFEAPGEVDQALNEVLDDIEREYFFGAIKRGLK
jgi:hypothetical protein